MVSPLVAKDTYPKKDIDSITQTGIKAYDLAILHKAVIAPRLPAGTIEGLDEDLTNLGVAVPAVKQAHDEAQSATVDQNAVVARGYERVRSIRSALRDAGAPKQIQRAYGVGQNTRVSVRDVSAAIQQILDRIDAHPAEAKAFGILPEDVAGLSADLEAITDTSSSQDKKRARAPLTTKERNRTANRIVKAIRRIAGAGKIAFVRQPVVLASFIALQPKRRSRPKAETQAQADIPQAQEEVRAEGQGQEEAQAG